MIASRLLPAAIGIFALTATTLTAQTLRPEFPVFDGLVNTVVVEGDAAYVGGEFTSASTFTGSLALTDTTTGERVTTPPIPAVDGEINAVVSDGAGGLYIGGNFTAVGGLPRARLARILANGTVDPTLDIGFNVLIRALHLAGTTLFVGGDFNTITTPGGTVFRNRLVGIDTSSNTLLTWNPNPNGIVRTFTDDGGTLYVGGGFTGFVDPLGAVVLRRAVAAFDLATLTIQPFVAGLTEINGTQVRDLFLDSNVLYLAGIFESGADSTARRNAMGIDLGTGLPTTFDPQPNLAANVIHVVADTIFVGGEFTTVGGVDRRYLAGFDLATGSLTSFDANLNFAGQVFDLSSVGTELYAVGRFEVGGRLRAAAFNPATAALGAWNPRALGEVNAVLPTTAGVAIAGEFTGINGVDRSRLAAVDLATGDLLPWAPVADNTVTGLAFADGDLFVAGSFDEIDGQARAGLARLDPDTGALASGFDPAPFGSDFTLIFPDNDRLYVAGAFTTIGGQSAGRLARFDPVTEVVDAWTPQLDVAPAAIAATADTIYVGGPFTTASGESRASLAAFAKSDAALMPWNPGVDARITSLAIVNGQVVFGGLFGTVGGTARGRLAAVDQTTGLLAPWNPGTPGITNAIREFGPELFVAGGFQSVSLESRPGLASLSLPPDTSTLNPLTIPGLADLRALAASGTNLILAGADTGEGRSGLGVYAFPSPFPSPTPTPTPPPTQPSPPVVSPAPTLIPNGKTRLTTTRPRIVLRGTAANASAVEFQAPPRRGFRPARGSALRWRIPLRLTATRNIIRVRATGPGGASRPIKFVVRLRER